MWKTSQTENRIFNLLNTTNEIIAFDVETTGLKKTDKIIQISGIKFKVLKQENGLFKFEKIDSINYYINPLFAIDEKITEITGITNEFLENQPTEDEIIDKVYAFMGSKPCIVGYNVKFDSKKLYDLYTSYDLTLENAIYDDGKFKGLSDEIDVMKMAKDLIDKNSIENYKLITVAEMCGFDKDVSFHSSIDDSAVTEKLFELFLYDYYSRHKEDDSKEKQKVVLKTTSYWNKYGHKTERLYINSEFYFNFYTKEWNVKSDYDINDYDMEDLRMQVLKKYNAFDEDELISKVRRENRVLEKNKI